MSLENSLVGKLNHVQPGDLIRLLNVDSERSYNTYEVMGFVWSRDTNYVQLALEHPLRRTDSSCRRDSWTIWPAQERVYRLNFFSDYQVLVPKVMKEVGYDHTLNDVSAGDALLLVRDNKGNSPGCLEVAGFVKKIVHPSSGSAWLTLNKEHPLRKTPRVCRDYDLFKKSKSTTYKVNAFGNYAHLVLTEKDNEGNPLKK